MQVFLCVLFLLQNQKCSASFFSSAPQGSTCIVMHAKGQMRLFTLCMCLGVSLKMNGNAHTLRIMVLKSAHKCEWAFHVHVILHFIIALSLQIFFLHRIPKCITVIFFFLL